jgi:diguanylate cyclase (GGDEF)-like protein
MQKQAFEEQKRELEVMNAQLRELATVDGLTNLKNQRAFYERLQDVTQYSIRYYVLHSLLLLDVDNFKEYNDSFGHLAGDEVLREIALILLEQTRDTDFVARYGGEEYAVILPLANREESRLTAERIRRAVAIKKWPHRPVTISIGVATAIGNEYEVRDFVLAADQALYESKRRGRNRVTCVDDLTAHTEHGHIIGVIDQNAGPTRTATSETATPMPDPAPVSEETSTP